LWQEGRIIMLDGDEAGQRAMGEIASRLAHRVWVRVLDVPEGKQLDQLSTQELQEILLRRSMMSA